MVLWIFKAGVVGMPWEITPIVDIKPRDSWEKAHEMKAHAQYLADAFHVEIRMHGSSLWGYSDGEYFHPSEVLNDRN